MYNISYNKNNTLENSNWVIAMALGLAWHYIIPLTGNQTAELGNTYEFVITSVMLLWVAVVNSIAVDVYQETGEAFWTRLVIRVYLIFCIAILVNILN